MKKITRVLLAFVMILTVSIPALAADGNVTYSGNAGQFIFAPGSGYSLTDLFPNFKDVMPGDTLTQNITVRNNASKSVKISMRALGAHENSKEFLSQLNLYVEKVTDTPLFEASADQTAQLTEWKTVGVLSAGGEAELQVVLEVPTSLNNEQQSQIGYLDWEFMVEEIDDGKTQTGDNAKIVWGVIGLVASAVLIIFIVIWRCKRKEKEND